MRAPSVAVSVFSIAFSGQAGTVSNTTDAYRCRRLFRSSLPGCRMPTGLPLDFDALLAPIGGAEQAGSSSTYLELRSQLDDLRKEVNPDDFDADDLTRPDQPKYADWSKVEELTRKALEKDAKDL